MSRRYTLAQRAEALARLRINRNNIALTSHQTGIPQRTLREWRQQLAREDWLPGASKPVEIPLSAFEDRAEAIKYIQDHILEGVVNMADSLGDILLSASPYHQLLAMVQLVDRLEMLESLVTDQQTEHTYRVEFVNPNTGTVSLKPYWEADDDDDTVQ